MILLSPVFAYLAELVHYAEPLENVAEEMGLHDTQTYTGIFPDYTIPGLNDYLGTLISGAIGVAIFLSVAMMRRHAPAN
ncbi:PDGLE domain-containing protein [Geoglobus ahangari]